MPVNTNAIEDLTRSLLSATLPVAFVDSVVDQQELRYMSHCCCLITVADGFPGGNKVQLYKPILFLAFNHKIMQTSAIDGVLIACASTVSIFMVQHTRCALNRLHRYGCKLVLGGDTSAGDSSAVSSPKSNELFLVT